MSDRLFYALVSGKEPLLTKKNFVEDKRIYLLAKQARDEGRLWSNGGAAEIYLISNDPNIINALEVYNWRLVGPTEQI